MFSPVIDPVLPVFDLFYASQFQASLVALATSGPPAGASRCASIAIQAAG